MKASDFDYDLPESLIAQRPLPQRGDSRLLIVDPQQQQLSDRVFNELVNHLDANDLLVFNDTRVFPARLRGAKSTGGKVEVLVERIVNGNSILAQVRSSKSPRPGAELILEQAIQCKVVGRQDEFFVLEQNGSAEWLELLQQYGHMPLPPYIQRDDDSSDRERYQTVYSARVGAVAAPTAGLHFDSVMLDRIAAMGVASAFVTLHVGAGTFQPLRVEDVSAHRMHAEWLEVPESSCKLIERTKNNGGRVIAVGTTVVRSLESAAQKGVLKPFSGDTRLFITPGYSFRVVDAMLTNFHLPQSTLMMLVSAFAGKSFMLDAYRHAVAKRYRFFSYGDAMFITGRNDAANPGCDSKP